MAAVEDCMNIQYNALEYAHQLESAGVPQPQAEVHANMLGRVLSDCVAAPADLHALRGDLTHQIVETETRLRAEIAEAEARLHAEIAEAEARLRAEIAQVEARLTTKIEVGIERLSARIDKLDDAMGYLKWMNALTLAMLLGLIVKSTFV
jgi:chromosome segregation ATPase